MTDFLHSFWLRSDCLLIVVANRDTRGFNSRSDAIGDQLQRYKRYQANIRLTLSRFLENFEKSIIFHFFISHTVFYPFSSFPWHWTIISHFVISRRTLSSFQIWNDNKFFNSSSCKLSHSTYFSAILIAQRLPADHFCNFPDLHLELPYQSSRQSTFVIYDFEYNDDNQFSIFRLSCCPSFSSYWLLRILGISDQSEELTLNQISWCYTCK